MPASGIERTKILAALGRRLRAEWPLLELPLVIKVNLLHLMRAEEEFQREANKSWNGVY